MSEKKQVHLVHPDTGEIVGSAVYENGHLRSSTKPEGLPMPPPEEPATFAVTTPDVWPQEKVDAAIATRVAAAMAEVPDPIPRDSRNQYASYDYASADAVFRAVRPVLAKHGLSVRQQEQSFELLDREKSTQVKVQYAISFECPEGCGTPDVRTQTDQMKGAQTLQAVATYALKYWLRSRLLLNTGDPDTDAEPKAEPTTQTAAKPKPRARKAPAQLKWRTNEDGVAICDNRAATRDDDYRRSLYRYLMAQIKALPLAGVALFMEANETNIADLPDPAQHQLNVTASTRLAKDNADAGDVSV